MRKSEKYAEDFIKHIQELHLSFLSFAISLVGAHFFSFFWLLVPCNGFHLFLCSVRVFFVVTFAYFFPLFNKIKRLKYDGDFSRKCWLTFGAMLRHFVKQIHTTQKFHFFIISIFLFVMTIFSAMFLAFIWIMKAIRGNRRVRQFIPNQMKLGICKKKFR